VALAWSGSCDGRRPDSTKIITGSEKVVKIGTNMVFFKKGRLRTHHGLQSTDQRFITCKCQEMAL
jgi:hypothetical protein